MSFAVGSLVRARGREWVVLPESEDDLLLVRPLGGTDDEVAGIHLGLETVEPAQFDLPDPKIVGDHASCRLLRDAVRISSRAAAGPFRSFGRIAVEPRPYQLVPLLMGLKLDPVRLLIADDVGIGKTIEACLLARELLDRGEIHRIAVLCPPHLAEQWQTELNDKFHIEAELVLPSTASRLERRCRGDQSLFDVYPHVVVSMDFIKTDRRRDEFVRTCPECVIVDEAHTCAFGYERRGGRHQRNQLIRQLAASPDRHLILVTATPHSGKEAAFRSLLSLLDPDFESLPDELGGRTNEKHRRRLAAHFVQRRRVDIRRYLDTETFFPEREETEATYEMSKEYRKFLDRVLRYCEESIRDEKGGRHRQRVRWWSALALLRCVSSSPAAAAATLRERNSTADTETPEQADEVGRRAVFDISTDDPTERADIVPGSDAGDAGEDKAARRRLLDMAKTAEKLKGKSDKKLVKAASLIKQFLKDGFRPIVFCRFIATAEYVAEQLRKLLPKNVSFGCVTGTLAPSDREKRVLDLAREEKRILVCTDCLSEGINLQKHFDAVLHYDLSWSPTRHEQREGRVDRFGQARKVVRVLTLYGKDNPIDGLVLDVLIRKHKTIRSSLGISVPVPVDTDAILQAVFEGIRLREHDTGQTFLAGMEEHFRPRKEEFQTLWENAADREKRSRTMFAQEIIKVDDVARELQEARQAAGSSREVSHFTVEAVKVHGGSVKQDGEKFTFSIEGMPRAVRDALGNIKSIRAAFDAIVDEGVVYLGRTHPIVQGLAAHVMDTALDPNIDGKARRAGAIRTGAVRKRTTLLLVRLRYDIITRHRTGGDRSQLAEEVRLVAFEGAPDRAKWLDAAAAEALLEATPDENILPEQQSAVVSRVVEGFAAIVPHLEEEALRRAGDLLEAHTRVRKAARVRGLSYKVEPKLPPDVLGIYVFLPARGGSARA